MTRPPVVCVAENELYRKCTADCDAALSIDPTCIQAYLLKGQWRLCERVARVSRHVEAHHITPRHTTRNSTSRHFTRNSASHHVTSLHATSRRTTSRVITSRRTTSCV